MPRIYIYMMLSVITFSCQKVLEIDVALDKPKVALNAFFNPDSTWMVSITSSRSILDNAWITHFQPMTDALVTIIDQNNNVIDTLKLTPSLNYRGTTIPTSGQSYIVHVSKNSDTSIQAESHIPTLVPIISVEVDSSLYKSMGDKIIMNVTFKDLVNEKNYYNFLVLHKIGKNNDEVIHTETLDPSFEKNQSSENGIIFSDTNFDGKEYTLRLKVSRTAYPQTTDMPYRVVLISASEDYYQYFSTKNLQDRTNGDPFSQPTQVYTNVKDGLGIFAGYSSSTFGL